MRLEEKVGKEATSIKSVFDLVPSVNFHGYCTGTKLSSIMNPLGVVHVRVESTT